jgi:hypothetical protein
MNTRMQALVFGTMAPLAGVGVLALAATYDFYYLNKQHRKLASDELRAWRAGDVEALRESQRITKEHFSPECACEREQASKYV